MTAVALQPGEILAAATSLPDNLSAAAIGELTLALGRAPQPSEIAGLVRRGDGRTWLLSHRIPAVSKSELGAFVDTPWSYMGGAGMRFTRAFGPIAEVAQILVDPSSPDAEVRRRERLHEQMQRELHERQERERAEQVAAGAREAEERRRRARASTDFRESDWGPLPPMAKLLYLIALSVDDGTDVASELRRLAGEFSRKGTLPWPERRWW
jgi:hypothetical protein